MDKFSNQDWLIIANGPLYPVELIKKLQNGRKVLALDGSIISCINRNIIPDVLLGDFDSVDNDLIENVEKKYQVHCVFLPDQDSTDLEKGLQFITKFHPKSITICQAIGARLDHTIHNIRLLKRMYSNTKNVTIFTETEKIYYIKNKNVVVSADNFEPLALVSFPKAVVSSQGLKYDMDKLTLDFAKRESTSNHLARPSARINICGEILLIISHQTELYFV